MWRLPLISVSSSHHPANFIGKWEFNILALVTQKEEFHQEWLFQSPCCSDERSFCIVEIFLLYNWWRYWSPFSVWHVLLVRFLITGKRLVSRPAFCSRVSMSHRVFADCKYYLLFYVWMWSNMPVSSCQRASRSGEILGRPEAKRVQSSCFSAAFHFSPK